MTFALRQDESISKGVRRIVRKQLKSARDTLQDSNGESLDERVHSVRKCFKRIRAVVRLLRYSIGESTYRRENECFRDAARPLSELRDAKVLIEVLDKLEKISRRSDKKSLFRSARKRLKARRNEVHERVLRENNALAETGAAIEESLKRFDDWSDVSTGWREIAKGIRRVYRSGRKALDNAKDNSSVESLHEFRKQVKYLRHQLELLARSWPKVVCELVSQAEEIGDILGEDHDLAVLHKESNGMDSSQNAPLHELIEHRRSRLQEDAIPKGEILYREPAKDFERRLEAYWKGSEKWPKRHKASKPASSAV